jgi:hypothetical protein
VTTRPPISEPTAAFLEAGLSITLATRDGELQPDGAAAWAARVHEDRTRLTLFLYEEAARGLLPNLKAHPEIAAVFDQPTTHRACQVKGRFLSARRARAAERGEIERQADGFAAELEAIGIPRVMTGGWKRWPCTALEMQVTHLYEQTPGPGAGEPLP